MCNDVLSNLVIKKVLSVNTIFSDKGANAKKINRPCWAIILKFEGETEYKCGGKTLISNNENIVILPKGSSYEWVCKKAGRFFTVEFSCDLCCWEIMSFPISSNEKIIKAFKQLEYKLIAKSPFYKLEATKLTYDILLNILSSTAKSYLPKDKRDKIQVALDFMAENYASSITNDSLAALTPFSTVYFRKLFTEMTGLSPMVYLRNIRINKAKQMLKSDYGSISDIAVSLGYSNIYEFSRTFKKHTGLSPTEYLKSNVL